MPAVTSTPARRTRFQRMQHSPFPPLPCYPCPHHSACCAFGATLSREEAREIRAVHGRALIYRTRWGEWRTRVVKGRCGFLQNNACTIYNKPYYPAVCRGFPWIDAETGGPYEYDRAICPEFRRRPELLQINPYVNPRNRKAAL
jgi:putative zinc- or iron-chelating protein